MKFLFIITLSFASVCAKAQSPLIPASNLFEKKWIKSNNTEMTLYGIKDTATVEMGTIQTRVVTDSDKLTIVTSVAMRNMKTPWIDSTVANIKDFNPVYHSSYNMQRDMVLHFGKIVTGYYYDKIKRKTITINDTTTSGYFDSNLYPYLIGRISLKDGLTKEISIYDYNPSGKTGVIKAFVQNVKSDKYETLHSGTRKVWVVTVSDEIGDGENGTSTYYFDKEDRKLWKQEINAGGRKMLLLLKEQG